MDASEAKAVMRAERHRRERSKAAQDQERERERREAVDGRASSDAPNREAGSSPSTGSSGR
jgi:hypothetical protein